MSEIDQRSRILKTPSSELAYRSSVGLAAELYFASIMIGQGYDLYQPLVDVKIDYLAKSFNERELRFQCKWRNSRDEHGFTLTIPSDQRIKAPTHLFLMIGSPPNPEFWIFPYQVFKKHSQKVLIEEKLAFRLNMTQATEAILEKYKNLDGFKRLTDWCLDENSERSA